MVYIGLLGAINMKTTISIIFILFFVLQGMSQTKDTVYLKGFPDHHWTDEQKEKYDSLIFIQSKVDLDRKSCWLFADTIKSKYYIFLEKESYENDSLWFTLLDIIEIGSLPKNGTIAICSREFQIDNDESEKFGFVISVECCYDYEDEYAFYKSHKILKLWSNQNGKNKFIELDPNLYVRYNEGFYRINKNVPNTK